MSVPNALQTKIDRLLVCPTCKGAGLQRAETSYSCTGCDQSYEILNDTPILVPPDSPVLKWYKPQAVIEDMDSAGKSPSGKGSSRVDSLLLKMLQKIMPTARLWSRVSQQSLQEALTQKDADDPERNVILVGAGFEPVYQKLCAPFDQIIRVGLAHRGEVNICCDTCAMPVSDASIDLVISSSVLEHVYDPEKAVAEMARTLKEDGYVYAEIPFMRAFHMAPIDYQRYTISGIEELFRRHGFELLSKGICSGPFTAWALFAKDFGSGLFSFNRYLRAGMALLLGIVFHPFKYLDRLCEKSKWAQVCACNFYYLGRKTRQRDRTV